MCFSPVYYANSNIIQRNLYICHRGKRLAEGMLLKLTSTMRSCDIICLVPSLTKPGVRSLWTITYNFVHINEYFLNHHGEISLLSKFYKKEKNNIRYKYIVSIHRNIKKIIFSKIHSLHFSSLFVFRMHLPQICFTA